VTPCSEAASSKCWLLGLRESLTLQRILWRQCFVLCCVVIGLFCVFASFFHCELVCVNLHICAYTRRRMCGREKENIS
jgi:hypothetical protein